MNAIQNTIDVLLPPKARPYAKAIVALVVSVLAVLTVALPVVPSWVAVAVAVLNAPLVWAVPNGETEDPEAY